MAGAEDVADVLPDIEAPPMAAARAFRNGANGVASEPEITPFDTFDARNWQGVPIEPRRWSVSDWMPAGEPGLMSGSNGQKCTRSPSCRRMKRSQGIPA